MAFIQNGYCSKHGATSFINGLCSECNSEEVEKEKEEWNKLSVEERLDNLNERIKRLEQGPALY